MYAKKITKTLKDRVKYLYENDFKDYIDDRITVLSGLTATNKEEQNILNGLIKFLPKIVCYTPTEQQKAIDALDAKYPDIFWDTKAKNPKGKRGRIKRQTPFSDRIQKALDYNTFRNKYANKIHDEHGIKACPYCNANLTIVARNVNGTYKNRFQLDHYFPKSQHPWLSISFFNLVPSCGNCNLTKSSSPVNYGKDFHLYRDKNSNPFLFILEPKSKAKYLINFDPSEIKIVFKENKGEKASFASNHDKSYDIMGIYNTQKDLIDELIQKSLKYTPKYRKELQDQLKKLSKGNNPIYVNRLITGNYYLAKDIHLRPMAKFTQDIAKNVKLI